jgi:5-methylcytosine-specific restriction endonuclease McrA
MELQTLVLSPWYSPHQITSWQESITLVYLDKAQLLEAYDFEVSSPSITLKVPSVVRLKALKAERRSIKFSRHNVYARDKYECSYCGASFAAKNLNYDHVVPRSRGGKTDFLNVTTSCTRCNSKKANRTPKEAGMRLLKQPTRPSSLPMSATPIALPKMIPELWLPYLQDRIAKVSIG